MLVRYLSWILTLVLNVAADLRRSDDTVVEAGNYQSPSPSNC